MVAVAERFALASLMIFDMRAVLRDLAREAPDGARRDRGSQAQRTILGRVSAYAEEAAGVPAPPPDDPKAVRARLLHGRAKRRLPADTEAGRALFRAAAELIDVAR